MPPYQYKTTFSSVHDRYGDGDGEGSVIRVNNPVRSDAGDGDTEGEGEADHIKPKTGARIRDDHHHQGIMRYLLCPRQSTNVGGPRFFSVWTCYFLSIEKFLYLLCPPFTSESIIHLVFKDVENYILLGCLGTKEISHVVSSDRRGPGHDGGSICDQDEAGGGGRVRGGGGQGHPLGGLRPRHHPVPPLPPRHPRRGGAGVSGARAGLGRTAAR